MRNDRFYLLFIFFSRPFSLLLSSFLALLTVRSQGCAPIVLLPSRNALATAPHWFLYYCSSHDDISHFVSSAVFPPLISIADYSASVSSDLMREPTELLLPSFTVIALCSPPAGRPGGSDSTERGAANIIWGGGGNQHSDISAGGCDWQRTTQAHMGQSTNTVFFWHELCSKVPDFVALSQAYTARFQLISEPVFEPYDSFESRARFCFVRRHYPCSAQGERGASDGWVNLWHVRNFGQQIQARAQLKQSHKRTPPTTEPFFSSPHLCEVTNRMSEYATPTRRWQLIETAQQGIFAWLILAFKSKW